MQFDRENLKQDIRKAHNINVPSFVFAKLENHIRILKDFENRSITNQNWITNAIKKKIDKSTQILENQTSRKKTICVKIEPKILDKITDQVNFLKKHNGSYSYSKTKWIIEAIMDQLEEEQEKAKELLKK